MCLCMCVYVRIFVLVFAGRKKGQRGKVTLLSALFNAAKHTHTSTHGDYVHIFKYIYMMYTYGNNTVLTHSHTHAHTKWMGGHIYVYFFGDDLQQIARVCVCVCVVVRGEIV